MKKSAFFSLLWAVLLLGQIPFHAQAATYNIVGVEVNSPNQAQISKLYQNYNIKKALITEDTFTTEPSYESPYSSGALSYDSQIKALNTLNFARYVAGINYDIQLDDEFTTLAQDAAWINAITNELTHTPSTPTGMSATDDLVVSGKLGASKSNLSQTISSTTNFATKSLSDDIICGWLGDDSSYSNLTAVGHRRWSLNPLMSKTGFGSAINDSTYTSDYFDKYYDKYGAMYSIDQSNSDGNVDGVIWPSQNMPTEIFENTYPWSYSTSQEITGNIAVTLTHLNSNTTWNITSKDTDTNSTYLSVQTSSTNNYMGQKTCIIFRPDPSEVDYQAGDVYYVQITGDITASYGVFFFDVEDTTATSGALTPSKTATSFTYVEESTPEETTYTITFDGNSGVSSQDSVETSTSGTISALPTATREGYTFDGWFTSKTSTVEVSTSTIFTGDTTVYAQWTLIVVEEDPEEDDGVSYTVTFDGNRGVSSSDSVETSTSGKISTLPTATRDDYNFLGWFTSKTGTVKVSTSTVFTADTTVYAQWTTDTVDETVEDDEEPEESTTFTITFDGNNGTSSLETKETRTTGKLASLPTATRSGYDFDGWFTTKTGSTQITTSTVFEADTTVYAQWTEEEEVVEGTVASDKAVTYINKLSVQTTSGANFGGKVVMSNYTPEEGDVVTFTVSAYSRYNIYAVTVKNSSGNSVSLSNNNNGEYYFTQTDESLEIAVVFDFVPTEAQTENNTNVQVNFPDVTVNDWHEQYIRYVVGLEIMTGYDDYFYPDIAISRGEIARSLLNLSGQTATINWEMSYVDVYGTSYEDAVSWCVANGVMTGYSDEMFGTYYALTREEFSVTLASFARLMGHNGYAVTELSPLYDDTWTISWWALNSFTWAVENGLMIGYDYVLSPKDYLTRGQIAAILTTFHKTLLT